MQDTPINAELLLSLCIPTYSRAGMLIELLDSIANQDTEFDRYEVIVSDDASSDNTIQRVEDYATKLPNLTLMRHTRNIGFDRNFLEVASIAKGKYLWFLGDDDRLEPNALSRVVAALEKYPCIAGMTLGSIDYDNQLKERTGFKVLPPTQILTSAEEVFTKIGELLGFMSTLVIHRDSWNVVCREDPVQDFFKLYVQVYIIGRVLKRKPQWLVLNDPCAGYRSDNDQFIKMLGWHERLAADVEAYHAIAADLFGDSSLDARNFETRIFNAHIRSRLINGADSGSIKGTRAKTIWLLLRRYYWFSAFWHTALPIILTPRALVSSARKFYQSYIPSSGTRRAKSLKGTTSK